jgi:hypothetical protein
MLNRRWERLKRSFGRRLRGKPIFRNAGLADWYHRQRAQQWMNFGLVAVTGAGADCEATLRGITDPEIPIHVLRNIYIAGYPACMCRMLTPPFGIVKEAVDYKQAQYGMIKRFLRHDLRASRAKPLGDVMCLALYYSQNYYHWLIDYLPMALLAEEVGFTGTYLVPQAPFVRRSLELLGIGGARVVEHNIGDFWRAERLFVSRFFGYELQFARPKLLAGLRAALLAALPKPEGMKRLYISRNRPGVARDIVNEAELKPLLERFGFTEYFCEDHSIADQLAAFAGAEAVIGSDGAGLANALVMPEGALLVALFSPLRFKFGGTLVQARIAKLKYYTVMADQPPEEKNIPYPHGDPVMAYLELIESTLERELT